jgi:hypothetical protein
MELLWKVALVACVANITAESVMRRHWPESTVGLRPNLATSAEPSPLATINTTSVTRSHFIMPFLRRMPFAPRMPNAQTWAAREIVQSQEKMAPFFTLTAFG